MPIALVIGVQWPHVPLGIFWFGSTLSTPTLRRPGRRAHTHGPSARDQQEDLGAALLAPRATVSGSSDWHITRSASVRSVKEV